MMATLQSECPAAERDAILLRESTFREAGVGPAMPLGPHQGRDLVMTLDITRAIDQASLSLSIWGSADGLVWDTNPLVCLPQKYYCGTYRIFLSLVTRPDIRYLRAKWTIRRLVQDARQPVFTFHVSAQAERSSATAYCS